MDMLLNFSTLINNIAPFVPIVLMAIVAVVVIVVCVILALKQLKKQIKLYNSITLVELKNAKIHYWVFIVIIAFLIFYTSLNMFDSRSFESVLMQEVFHMQRYQTVIMLACLLLTMLTVEFLLVVMAFSRSAVVDKGVYAGFKYLEWYDVHDYIIDEDRGLVILTANKNTFSTLLGTTPPLKVSRNDIAKLKFILNKNKNKFSGFFK